VSIFFRSFPTQSVSLLCGPPPKVSGALAVHAEDAAEDSRWETEETAHVREGREGELADLTVRVAGERAALGDAEEALRILSAEHKAREARLKDLDDAQEAFHTEYSRNHSQQAEARAAMRELYDIDGQIDLLENTRKAEGRSIVDLHNVPPSALQAARIAQEEGKAAAAIEGLQARVAERRAHRDALLKALAAAEETGALHLRKEVALMRTVSETSRAIQRLEAEEHEMRSVLRRLQSTGRLPELHERLQGEQDTVRRLTTELQELDTAVSVARKTVLMTRCLRDEARGALEAVRAEAQCLPHADPAATAMGSGESVLHSTRRTDRAVLATGLTAEVAQAASELKAHQAALRAHRGAFLAQWSRHAAVAQYLAVAQVAADSTAQHAAALGSRLASYDQLLAECGPRAKELRRQLNEATARLQKTRQQLAAVEKERDRCLSEVLVCNYEVVLAEMGTKGNWWRLKLLTKDPAAAKQALEDDDSDWATHLADAHRKGNELVERRLAVETLQAELPTLRRSIAQTPETAQLPLAAWIAKATQVQESTEVRDAVRSRVDGLLRLHTEALRLRDDDSLSSLPLGPMTPLSAGFKYYYKLLNSKCPKKFKL